MRRDKGKQDIDIQINYQNWILEELLKKYEASKAFTSGVFSKRILIDLKKEKRLQECMEHAEEKSVFLSVLDLMKRDGLIDYSWEKYEEGNLVEKVWLIPEEESIKTCYSLLKRVPRKESADLLKKQIQSYIQGLDQDMALYLYLNELYEKLTEKQRTFGAFTEDEKENEDVLKCLVYMEKNKDEIIDRLMSSKLYGHSKHFERYVKPKVLSILRHVKKKENEDVPEDDELLREKGIVRWPEIMEFTGEILTVLKDGTVIDYGTQKYGAYINSDTVKQVKEVKMKGINKIIFIENKANYIWYVSHKKAKNELVIFHGGCYSPVKGLWLQKIYDGSKSLGCVINYVHWSDIDVGGFQIFHRLKSNIVPELEPYKMDEITLENFLGGSEKIKSLSYINKLKEMGMNEDFKEFWGVIQKMLIWGVRLEQEQIILSE